VRRARYDKPVSFVRHKFELFLMKSYMLWRKIVFSGAVKEVFVYKL